MNSHLIGSQFETGHVSGEFEGKTYDFTFPYRSPRNWLESILEDPDLAPLISWYPVQKFLVVDGNEMRLYDEPNSGTTWWNAQVLQVPLIICKVEHES